MKVKSESHSVVSNSLWPHRLYSPWDSPGQNTGAHSLSLLQGIFPTQGLNSGLPHCRQILYQLSHKGSPIARLNFIYLFWLYWFFVIYQHSYFIINNLSPNICTPQRFLLPSWWGVPFILLPDGVYLSFFFSLGFYLLPKGSLPSFCPQREGKSCFHFLKLTFWFSLHASSLIIFNPVQSSQHWLSPQYMSGTLLAPGSREISKAQPSLPGFMVSWCFWTVVLEKRLESPLDCKEIKSVNPKGNQPWIFIGRTDAEPPILWPSDAKSQLIGKDPDGGKDWRQEEKGMTEDDMVGYHHQLNGHEFEQTPVDSEGQGSLVCCSPWGHNESDTASQLNDSIV